MLKSKLEQIDGITKADEAKQSAQDKNLKGKYKTNEIKVIEDVNQREQTQLIVKCAKTNRRLVLNGKRQKEKRKVNTEIQNNLNKDLDK
jgi:hypothetical protein